MTREEAVKWLKEHHSIDLNTQDDEAHRMAIKALEQEIELFKSGLLKDCEVCKAKQDSVLDQIKAEIEQNAYPIVHGVNNHEKGMTLNGILQIINKYKAGE